MGQANGALLVVFGTKKGDILLEWVIWGSGKLQCEAFIGPRRPCREAAADKVSVGTANPVGAANG